MNRNFNFKFFILIITVFSFYSCDEGNQIIYNNDAKLIWKGEYYDNGCGFFIEIDSVQYKPENEGVIPLGFKKSKPLNVTVQYIDLLYEIEYYCGEQAESKYAHAIELTSINLNK